MEELILHITPKPSPYSKEFMVPDEKWGHILIRYGKSILLDCEWNVNEVIEFFQQNKLILQTEKYPFDNRFCIIGGRYKLYDLPYDWEGFTSEEVARQYYNHLDAYFLKHSFKLRGTDTPRFFIGLKSNGLGEISYREEEKYYRHFFKMDLFLKNVEDEIHKFLTEYYLYFE